MIDRAIPALLVVLLSSCSGSDAEPLMVCGERVDAEVSLRQIDGLGATDGLVVYYLVGEVGQLPPRSIAELFDLGRSSLEMSEQPGEGDGEFVPLGSLSASTGGCLVLANLYEGEAARQVLIGSGITDSEWVVAVSWPADESA